MALFFVSQVGGRAIVLGLSAAAHAAVFAAAYAGGHGSPSVARADSIGEIAIEVATAPQADAPAPTPETNEHEATHAHPHSHTHPYPVSPDHDAHPHDPSIEHAPFAPNLPPASAEAAPSEAPAVSVAHDEVPHFTIAIGSAASASGHVATGATSAGHGASGDDDGDAIIPASAVSTQSTLAYRAPISYPPNARAAGVEGDVPLEIVVDARGAVVSARVVKHAGYGLDEAALTAIRGYRFTPAMRDGRAVRVRMTWAVEFRLE